MRVVDAGYEIIKETEVRKRIERGARLCYKSEDFIKEGSDVKIITALGKKQHTAMFEHGNLVFEFPKNMYEVLYDNYTWVQQAIDLEAALNNPDLLTSNKGFLRFTSPSLRVVETEDYNSSERYLVSGNIRAWIEAIVDILCKTELNSMVQHILYVIKDVLKEELKVDFVKQYLEDRGYNCPEGLTFPDDMANDEAVQMLFIGDLTNIKKVEDLSSLSISERLVHDTLSVIFTVDRGVTHELVRMRRASFAQESTRYCNYANDKFDNEITVIKPVWWDKWSEATRESWERAMIFAEEEYMNMTKDETVKAQQARAVLPHSLKVDIMVTAPMDEWRHIFNLRACDATGPAHPQMKEVMIPLLKEVQTIYPDLFGDMVPAEVI